MNRHTVLIVAWIFVGAFAGKQKSPLKVKYSWPIIAFDYDDIKIAFDDVEDGTYDYTKNFVVDVQPVSDGRHFLTIHRDDGVPATLGTISKRVGPGGIRLLRPYPNFSQNDPSNCSNLIGVFRMAEHATCNRLWVLDSGQKGSDQICPPKLVSFDLSKNSVDQLIEVPKEAVNPNVANLMANIIIDTAISDCNKITMYMTDLKGGAMVIYNEGTFTRVESPFFKSDPLATTFNVNGTVYVEELGLTGLALTKDDKNVEDRRLYFRPFASYSMYYAKATDLLTKMNDSIGYTIEPNQLLSQSGVMVISQAGIMFFSDLTACSMLCWNTHKPFTSSNIVTVAQSKITMQWVTGLKIVSDSSSSERLFVLSNRYQAQQTGTLDFENTNFRILVGIVEDLVRGTNCEMA